MASGGDGGRGPGGRRRRAPAVVVAPVRALLQRLGPVDVAASPVTVTSGARIDLEDLVSRLVARGYRREYQVEHRGEVSVRGGIVDVFPSTSDLPVRIDLWGDEVDRLTEFDPGDQRSVTDLEGVELFGCREVLPSEAVRASGPASLVGDAPWGRAQWERLAEGQLFDGMESWLPWLDDEERVLPDLVDAGARVVLIDPRRMRDRAAELNDEEAALADALAVTWGVVEDQAGDEPDGGETGARAGSSPAARGLRAVAREVSGPGAQPGLGGLVVGHPRRHGPWAGSPSTGTGPGWPPGWASWPRTGTR